MKVLYVCPFANHAGHPPYEAVTETKALAAQGVDITLLTFDGLIKGVSSSVPELSCTNRHSYLVPLRKRQYTQWPLRIVEMVSTYLKASNSKYDIIHLRDGDPFVWLAPALSSKGQRWVVSLIGSSLFTVGQGKGIIRSVFDLMANNKIWAGVIERGLNKAHFQFITQDARVTTAYDSWMGGVLKGNVKTVERGVPPPATPMDKVEARVKLGLPMDKMVALVFGAPHGGKDTECVFKAVAFNEDVVLLHAGSSKYSIGMKPMVLSEKYNLNGQLKLVDEFVPEADKPMYFGAADVCVLSYTKSFKATSSMLWEACRFGLPVIASNSNHVVDAVFENALGLTFEAENAFELSQCMRRWDLLAPQSKEVMSRNCVQYAKDNSISVWAKNVVSEYQRMMS